MRKVYLFASAFVLSASAFGQMQGEKELQHISLPPDGPRPLVGDIVAEDRAPGDPIYQDDFSIPANWSTPADGNGHQWTIGTSTPQDIIDYMGGMASTTAGNGHASFNGIEFLLAAAVDPQDVELTLANAFDCTGLPYVTLEFEQRYRAFNTDQTFVEVSGDNGATWTQWEINQSLATNSPAVQELKRIDISAVAGNQSQVLVRFRWFNSSDDDQYGSGYGWCIDDLNVFESYEYDQEITAKYFRSNVSTGWPSGLEYYMIPDEQITTIEFSGETQNLGALDQPNAKLNVEVTGAGTYSGTSTPATLTVGSADSVACATTFTPSAMGTYDVTWWFDCDQAENVTDNDSLYDSFEVTDYEYARHNGSITSSIGNVTSNDGSPLTIGNVMIMNADGVIGKVSVRVTNDTENAGQIMYAQIMRYDDGLGEYVYVDQSADHTITAGEVGGYVDLYFDPAIPVYTDDDLLVLAGHYGGDPEVRFGLAQSTDEFTVLGYTSGSTSPFYLSSPSAVMVTLDMRDFSGVDELTANGFSIGQNVPNPFDNTSIINYTIDEASSVSVEFTDISGKVVRTINQGTQDAGSYQINLNANDFAQGVYFYTFTIGEKQVTKRMVVNK